MPYNFSWGTINSSNLKKKRIKLPVPFLAQAYFLDLEANLHFYGGAPSQDFFISKSEAFIKKHLFSRYHPFSYFNCRQGATVTVNRSRYFSSFISNSYSDPRFDLPSLSRTALGHNYLVYLELKLCNLLTRGLFRMPQGGYLTFRVESVSPLTMSNILPFNLRGKNTRNFWQTHFLKFALMHRHLANALYENVFIYSDMQRNLFEQWLHLPLFLRECGMFRKPRVAKTFLRFLRKRRPNIFFRLNTFSSHRAVFSTFSRIFIRNNNPNFLPFLTLSGFRKFKRLFISSHKMSNRFFPRISIFNSFLDNIMFRFSKNASIVSLRISIRNQTVNENINKWFRVSKAIRTNTLYLFNFDPRKLINVKLKKTPKILR